MYHCQQNLGYFVASWRRLATSVLLMVESGHVYIQTIIRTMENVENELRGTQLRFVVCRNFMSFRNIYLWYFLFFWIVMYVSYFQSTITINEIANMYSQCIIHLFYICTYVRVEFKFLPIVKNHLNCTIYSIVDYWVSITRNRRKC